MKQQLLRSIRLSDGAFADRLAAKYRWSIERYAALKEGALVYAIWQRSRLKNNEEGKRLHFTISPTYQITNRYQELGAKVKLLEHTVQQAAKRQKLLTRTVEQSIHHEQRVQYAVISQLTGQKRSKQLIEKYPIVAASRDKAGEKKKEDAVSLVGAGSKNDTVAEHEVKVQYRPFNRFYRGINAELRNRPYTIKKNSMIRVELLNRKESNYSNYTNDGKQASYRRNVLDSLIRSIAQGNNLLSTATRRQSNLQSNLQLDSPVQLLSSQVETDRLQKGKQLPDGQKKSMFTAHSWQTGQRKPADSILLHIRASSSSAMRASSNLSRTERLTVQSPTAQSDAQPESPASASDKASKPARLTRNTIEVVREISLAALDPIMRSSLVKFLRTESIRHYSSQAQDHSKLNDAQKEARSIYATFKNKEKTLVQRKHRMPANSNASHKTTLFIQSDYREILQRVRQLFAKESRTRLLRSRIEQGQKQENVRAGQSRIMMYRNKPELPRDSMQHRLIPQLPANWFAQWDKQAKSSSLNDQMELTKNHFIFKQTHIDKQIMMRTRHEQIHVSLSQAAQLAANRQYSGQGMQTRLDNQQKQQAEQPQHFKHSQQTKQQLQARQMQQIKQLQQARQLLQAMYMMSATQIEKKNTQILRRGERRISQLLTRAQERWMQKTSGANATLTKANPQQAARAALMQHAMQSSLQLGRVYSRGGSLALARAPLQGATRAASMQHATQSSSQLGGDYMLGASQALAKAPLQQAARAASMQHATQSSSQLGGDYMLGASQALARAPLQGAARAASMQHAMQSSSQLGGDYMLGASQALARAPLQQAARAASMQHAMQSSSQLGGDYMRGVGLASAKALSRESSGLAPMQHATQTRILQGRQQVFSATTVSLTQHMSHTLSVQQSELQAQAATVYPKAAQLSAPVSHSASAPPVETAVMQVLKRSEASAAAEKQSKQAIASIEAAVKVVEKELQHIKEQSSKPQTSAKQMTELVMREIAQQLRIGQLRRGL